MGKNTKIFIGALLLVTLVGNIKTFAQADIPYVNTYDAMQRGVNLADSEKFDEACKWFEKISRNDTDYTLAVYEDAIYRVTASEDSLAIPVCRKGLSLHSEYDPDFYKFLASAYTDMDKSEMAIKMLTDTAIPAYPRVYLLQYSLGLAYYKEHKYDSAIAAFQRALKLNVFHASSHYYIGRCCLEQGRMVPALLSLQFYLMLEPGTSRSYSTIQLMEQVTKGTYDYNKATAVDPSKYHDESFDDLDLVIKSKIAIAESYKSKTKVAFDVMKQCQLFMEKLSYTANTNNWWMEFYVPFFTDLEKKGYYEPYIYYIMQSVNYDALQKEISKDKRKIDDYTAWAGKWIADKYDKRDETVNGTKKTIHTIHYDNHLPEGEGAENSKEKTVGEWVLYNQYNGNLMGKGSFTDNGDRTGEWIFYYYDGTMAERTQYKDGKHEGLSETWWKNGSPRGKFNYHDDKLNGEITLYNHSGVMTSHGNCVNNKYSGKFTGYYGDGKERYEVTYNDQEAYDGDYKEFYVNGQLSFTCTYKSGKRQGQATFYWSNGQVKSQGTYKDDDPIGSWKYYFYDGILQKEGSFNNGGKSVDKWTLYFRNGNKSEEKNFNKNGDFDGPYIMYDNDGIKYGELDYKDGMLSHLMYFDKTGKVIYETTNKSGENQNEHYYWNGVKLSEGKVINGKRTGLWKFYTSSGTLRATEYYIKGELSGEAINYYTDGKVKDSLNYDDGQRNGLYHSYFENGQLKSMGWYITGQAQGDWNHYNIRGKLTSHVYYLNDNSQGYAEYYDDNGHMVSDEFTNPLGGYLDKVMVYDTNGSKIVYSYISDKGNGTYKLPYPNGQDRIERTYVSGNAEGDQKYFYYDGKLSAEGNYLLGSREGSYKSYYENGKLESDYNYESGDADGKCVNYYDNGKMKSFYNYVDGDKQGQYKEYYNSGSIELDGNDLDGDLEGRLKCYFDDSAFYGVKIVHDGLAVGYSYPGKNDSLVPVIPITNGTGKRTCYYKNGAMALDCTYKNNDLDGKRTMYNTLGKPYLEENYDNGNLQGVQKYYYKDGKLKSELNYYWGYQDGPSKYYYENGKIEHTENWNLDSREGVFKYYDMTGKLIKTVVYYNDNEVSETKAK